jgi:hypothetical protein
VACRFARLLPNHAYLKIEAFGKFLKNNMDWASAMVGRIITHHSKLAEKRIKSVSN